MITVPTQDVACQVCRTFPDLGYHEPVGKADGKLAVLWLKEDELSARWLEDTASRGSRQVVWFSQFKGSALRTGHGGLFNQP